MRYRSIMKLVIIVIYIIIIGSMNINALNSQDKDYVYESAECIQENEDYRGAVKIIQEGVKAKKIVEPFACSLIADAYLHSGDLNNAFLYSNRALAQDNQQSAVLSLAVLPQTVKKFLKPCYTFPTGRNFRKRSR